MMTSTACVVRARSRHSARVAQAGPSLATLRPKAWELVVKVSRLCTRPYDPMPIDVDDLDRRTFVGDIEIRTFADRRPLV
jgi:hypothetical protein